MWKLAKPPTAAEAAEGEEVTDEKKTSRKLPLCARCGDSLKRQGRMLVSQESPMRVVGWHFECWKDDPLFRSVFVDIDFDIIEKRGSGRVTSWRIR